MSWKKHFISYQEKSNPNSPISGRGRRGGSAQDAAKFQSWLPEVYVGQPNRIERYTQYDQMDMDSEINTALDTISEFSTIEDEDLMGPFLINWNEDPTDSEAQVTTTILKRWNTLNEWDRRIFKTFRNTIKYGDQPFIRDPDTWKLYWVDPMNVVKVVVDEAQGKEPAQYVIKNLDPNFEKLVITAPSGYDTINATGILSPNSYRSLITNRTASNTTAGGAYNTEVEYLIDASHVIHFALTDGMDMAWPFGVSILDPVFKTFKQKELLEDSIIIYRVQRAPERRIFYIDTGDMPVDRAMAHVERIKNEIHQRRIPTRSGGGSNMLDAQYNPLCLALDTEIPLLDGRTLELNELIKEYKEGKKNWVYSCNPETGEMVPGPITWAGITRKNTQVIKLHLDNGKSLTVTPDHKIPVWGKGFIEAQNLTEKDSLMSFESRFNSMKSNNNGAEYHQIYDHSKKDWVYTHRMIGTYFRSLNEHNERVYLEEFNDQVKNIIHHTDFNRFNNNPDNLEWMNHKDHLKFHKENNFWNNGSEEAILNAKDKIRKTNKQLFENYSELEKEQLRNRMRDVQKIGVYKRKNDQMVKEQYAKNASLAMKKFINDNPNYKEKLMKNLSTYQDNCPNQIKNYTFNQLQALYELAKNNDFKLKFLLKDIKNHFNLLDIIKRDNPPLNKHRYGIKTDILTQEMVYRTIEYFGYKNWMDFKRKKDKFNHRIVKIEWLENKINTGTITIDGQEQYHNYHTFATNSGIIIKNSVIEDYFFAQSADGRGSKVDTLTGGQNLGEIDDLKYFNNKMARALRVPSSYLPTGPEDGTANLNDGRVGTAYIQEYRFTMFCQRIQRILQPIFDREFKLFMKHRGYQVDAGKFEIGFVEPQNFSKFREIEIDGARIGVFNQMESVPYISKRFALKKWLDMDEEDILKNEQMWLEENPEQDADSNEDTSEFSDLGDVGVSGGVDSSLDDFTFDEDDIDDEGEDGGDFDPDGESPISGTENLEQGE